MRGNYKSPSELLQAQRETGKSYWDLVGKPLTPNTGYNLNNPHAAEESEYNKWYNGSKLSDEDSEKLQQFLEEYDKDVKSNSNSLPSYKGGKDKFTTFVERMGPKVYRQLHKQGIYNPYIYDNMMRQLAWESDYGTSPLAISNHNYGGVKSSNTEYAKYKDDDAFANYYVSLIRRKYPQAVKAKDAKSYAKELKKVGYYEDSLQNYSQKLSDMSSVSRAAKLHMHTNPKQYEVELLLDDLKNQSVQQPVSTRVEAPINKEPINKEPFVNTPIPTKAPLITRPEYLESNSLIKKSFEQNMDNMLQGKDFQFKLPGFKSGKEGDQPSTYYAGTLPEVTTEAYAPIRLTTYYPVVSKYPYTGHSELKIPIDRTTWYDYTGEKEFPERVLPYVTIDKKSRASDYNLVTNNCADATLNYLNKAFNTHESPMLFTTPGDVRDYAIHKLHGKLIHNNNGSDTVLIPRNARNKTKISKEALDLYSNSPKGTVRFGYNAHFKKGKDSGIKEYASNEDIHINPDGSITTRNGNTGSVILPDVNVHAQKDYNSAFDYSGANEVMGTIADFTPVVGDIKQGLEAANDLRKGNYKEAAIGAGLLLLPNVLEKPLKYAGKKAFNFLLDKAPDVVSKYRYLNKHYNPFIQEKRQRYQPPYFDYKENINAAKKEAVRSKIPIYNEDATNAVRREWKKEFVNNFTHVRDRVMDEVTSTLLNGSNYEKSMSRLRTLYMNDRVKKMIKDNPEYGVYLVETGKNPLSQHTVDSFLKRQGTSIRGVTADSDTEALKYLTTTDKTRNLKGGDMLDTRGGLYTSNAKDIANRFKNPVGYGVEDGYIGVVKKDFGIPKNIPIEEQLKQYRKKLYNADVLRFRPSDYNKDVVALETRYGDGGRYQVNQRAYLPKGEQPVNQAVTLSKLKAYRGQTDQLGRRNLKGAKYENVDDQLFIPLMINNTTDFRKYARDFIAHTKPSRFNGQKDYSRDFYDLVNTIEKRHNDRASKIYDLKHKLSRSTDRISKAKKIAVAAPIIGLPTAVIGNMMFQDRQAQRYSRTSEGRDYDKLANQYVSNLPDSSIEEFFDTYFDNRHRQAEAYFDSKKRINSNRQIAKRLHDLSKYKMHKPRTH